MARRETMLVGMRHSLHPSSRLFRGLLVLALLAWTTLAFDAFAHPIAMSGGSAAQGPITTGKAAKCAGTSMMHMSSQNSHHPAPSHPAGNGHGCCQNGNCYCASLCSGIADVPILGVRLQPAHDPVISFIHSEPVLTHSAPPLRPPIV